MILKSSRTDKNQGCRQLSKLRAPSEFGGWSGKRGFLCWWVAPSRGKPASQSHPARQKAVLSLGWLCLRHTVKPRDSHTQTRSQAWPWEHRKHSCSLGFMPGTLACWAKSLGVKSACPPRASSLLPDAASLIWLFQNPCKHWSGGLGKAETSEAQKQDWFPFFLPNFAFLCPLAFSRTKLSLLWEWLIIEELLLCY